MDSLLLLLMSNIYFAMKMLCSAHTYMKFVSCVLMLLYVHLRISQPIYNFCIVICRERLTGIAVFSAASPTYIRTNSSFSKYIKMKI